MDANEYLSPEELDALGLRERGKHVYVHRSAALFRPGNIRLGSYVRIDAHCILSARAPIALGSRVHIGSSVNINAIAPVTVGDFSGISSGTKVFTTDDDYGGEYLTGPTVPAEVSNIRTEPVTIRDHCIVGANSVILPGAVLEDGVAVGALSLVKGVLEAWNIYGGVPAKQLRPRSRELLKKASQID